LSFIKSPILEQEFTSAKGSTNWVKSFSLWNNAYPILKGTAGALGASKGINCVNCDPHADFRDLEGRHSGNGFSYAYADRFLSRYFIFGLHENYNPSVVPMFIYRRLRRQTIPLRWSRSAKHWPTWSRILSGSTAVSMIVQNRLRFFPRGASPGERYFFCRQDYHSSGFIVVVKKTFRYSNVFFYNHLCRNTVIRNIIMESGINGKGHLPPG